ncbi:MAG: DUF983 domain-containing protein [Alphaproteobacteria bacterium]|nr:MAG: DUF983 domain-containing protein [Alphaproteobacteria bacterium]
MRCPRCAKGRLFDGFLKLKPECDHCGLSFDAGDTADGPAVAIMFIAGTLVVGGALFVEIAYMPPLWVHVVLWVPLTLLLCVGLLRPLKGLTFALQYFFKAGTIETREDWQEPQ